MRKLSTPVERTETIDTVDLTEIRIVTRKDASGKPEQTGLLARMVAGRTVEPEGIFITKDQADVQVNLNQGAPAALKQAVENLRTAVLDHIMGEKGWD